MWNREIERFANLISKNHEKQQDKRKHFLIKHWINKSRERNRNVSKFLTMEGR